MAALKLTIACLLFTGTATAVDVVTEANAHATVRFGAAEVKMALGHKGINSGRILIGAQGDAIFSTVSTPRPKPPAAAEAYCITISGDTVAVEGSDHAGAMYGALDLAEQINGAAGPDWLRQLRGGSHSPYLEVRGINILLTAQGFDEPDSWYWSDSYWQRFLDMLARNRYNFLDVEGTYDLTVRFVDTFSYFVNLPQFPDVGVGAARARRNLERFRRVIQMAADRGIKVGLMNYMTTPPIGPWKTGRFMKDERFARLPQPMLANDRVADYTREAVRAVLKQLPDLWMFGFRIGEAGQSEDFYKKTYIEAVKDLPRSLHLYVRPWLADPQKVREIGALTDHRFYIKPKYIGEQLGLPYQAVTGAREYPASGSYEDYTTYAQQYPIIWHILAYGTHRVFHWGWPDFARRTVRSCKFGSGVGFSLEPMHKYSPATDYLHNNGQTQHQFYDWMFEQQWFWYLVWGRTAYDPEVSDEVWLSEFRRRFGDAAGERIYRAMVQSSKIVPFIYAYHSQGLDHQDMAPEFETGDHALAAWNTIWTGSRVVPFGGSNDDFLTVGALDRTAMADPASYADAYLKQTPSGRMDPWQAAEYLSAAAETSEREIAEGANPSRSAQKEFDCIRMDIAAVAELGRYYAERIQSVTHLAFYRATFDHPELQKAYENLQSAVAHWDRLSEITERHFGYVPEPIRMRTYMFRWRDEGRSLGVALEELNKLEAEFRDLPRSWRRATIVVGHVPPTRISPGTPFPMRVTFATGGKGESPHVSLWYRTSSDSSFQKLDLKLEDPLARTWVVRMPALQPGQLEYYFEADDGAERTYGGTLPTHPPYHVPITDDRTPPAITCDPAANRLDGNFLHVTAQVTDESGIERVRVYYKRMPSTAEWLSLDMIKTAADTYAGNVPVDPEGILYYLEAVDRSGNAANYPNFLHQTPYFVVNGRQAK